MDWTKQNMLKIFVSHWFLLHIETFLYVKYSWFSFYVF